MKKFAGIFLCVALFSIGCGQDNNRHLDVIPFGVFPNNTGTNNNPGNVSPVGHATFAFTAIFHDDPTANPLDQDFTFRAFSTEQVFVDRQNLPLPSFTQVSNFPFTLAQRLGLPNFFVFQFNTPNRHQPIYHMDVQILDSQDVDFESLNFISGPSLNPACQVSISFQNGTIRPTADGTAYELQADEVMTVTHATDALQCTGWL